MFAICLLYFRYSLSLGLSGLLGSLCRFGSYFGLAGTLVPRLLGVLLAPRLLGALLAPRLLRRRLLQ